MASDFMRHVFLFTRTWAMLGIVTLLFACAKPITPPPFTPPPLSTNDSHVVDVQAGSVAPAFHAGRFSLQIDGLPPQSFMASFDLTGGWPEGALNIYNPLGMQMVRVEWAARSARLLQGNQIRQAASLENLIFQLTGTQLPAAALVDWLSGKPTPVEGWNVDASEWHLRRLVLERVQPGPRTALRIAFEP